MVFGPRAAGKFIAKRSKHVKLVPSGISKLASNLADVFLNNSYSIKCWKQQTLNPKVANAEAVDWIFLCDTLNFSFWSDQAAKYTVSLDGIGYTGYWSLCAAINRALRAGIPITKPSYYGNLNIEQLAEILRPDSADLPSIPLIAERQQVVAEAGRVLCDKFAGSAVNMLQEANGSAQTLLKLIVENFSSFRDEAEFDGQKVAIYKRAQILIADIWACFEGRDLGRFDDIDTLTMFADYRIPQALIYSGALEYSAEFVEILKDESLPNGSILEVEIRGCSIRAVDLLVDEIRQLLKSKGHEDVLVNDILVDHYLWDYRREHADAIDAAHVPFHRTRCIYY